MRQSWSGCAGGGREEEKKIMWGSRKVGVVETKRRGEISDLGDSGYFFYLLF